MFLTPDKTAMPARSLSLVIAISALCAVSCSTDVWGQARTTASTRADRRKMQLTSKAIVSPKTYYVESWKDGGTRIREKQFRLDVTRLPREFKQVIKDE